METVNGQNKWIVFGATRCPRCQATYSAMVERGIPPEQIVTVDVTENDISSLDGQFKFPMNQQHVWPKVYYENRWMGTYEDLAHSIGFTADESLRLRL